MQIQWYLEERCWSVADFAELPKIPTRCLGYNPRCPLVLAGCGEGCEFTDSVRMGAWCEWVCPQTPGARERCHRSEAKELGGCGPRGAGRVCAGPFLPLCSGNPLQGSP